MSNTKVEKIKRKVGRPKGTKKIEKFAINFGINSSEKELIEMVFKKMNLDKTKKGNKKKMILRSLIDFIKNN